MASKEHNVRGELLRAVVAGAVGAAVTYGARAIWERFPVVLARLATGQVGRAAAKVKSGATATASRVAGGAPQRASRAAATSRQSAARRAASDAAGAKRRTSTTARQSGTTARRSGTTARRTGSGSSSAKGRARRPASGR